MSKTAVLRSYTTLFACLVVYGVTTALGEAQVVPSAPQSVCAARATLVTPLDGKHEARTFAVAFQAGGDSPGVLSGSLTMYVGDSRYDVPFHDLTISPTIDLATVTPLVVRFPSAVHIDAVYLSAINGPDGGPCALASEPRVLPELDDAYTQRALAITPLDAPPPVRDPAPCDKPYVEARGTSFAPPQDPDRSLTGGAGRVVRITVHLAADGSIVDLTPMLPRAPQPFEQAALVAARASKFTPPIVRCKPVEGGYIFVAVFGNRW